VREAEGVCRQRQKSTCAVKAHYVCRGLIAEWVEAVKVKPGCGPRSVRQGMPVSFLLCAILGIECCDKGESVFVVHGVVCSGHWTLDGWLDAGRARALT
jgi:hypothetical protein